MKFGERSADAAALAAIAALNAWVVLHDGFFALSDDDYARVVIAEQFAHAPSLDPSGTSWLPFPFWLSGGAMWLLFPSLIVARAVAVLASVVAVVLLHRAATLLGLTRGGAAAGVLISIFLPTASKLGVSFQPEALTAGLVVFAAATTQVDGAARVTGGLMLALATLSRYEAWPVAAAFTALSTLDALEKRPGAAPAAALGLLGPVAWLLHGVFRHGDALFFVRRVTAYRRALGDSETWLGSLVAYPYAALRAEPMLSALAVVVVILWLRGTLRLPPIRRFSLMLGALCVFLLLGRLMDGAPTHHDERPLLPVFWSVALLAADSAVRALAAMQPVARVVRAVLVVAIPITVLGVIVRRYLPGDPDAPRTDERKMGDYARKMTPSSFLVVDTPDYGYFAVIAAFGSPERAAPVLRHDPRDHAAAAGASSPESIANALRGTCPSRRSTAGIAAQAGSTCAYVVHESHREAIPALGAIAVTQGAFSLVREAH